MATLGFRFATLDGAIEQALRLTNFLGGAQHRDRRWDIRDQLIAAYENYHDQLNLANVLVRDITFTWASTRQLDLSTTTITYSDSTTSTGLTGWRERPSSIRSAGETWEWQLETTGFIDNARARFDRGNVSARYKWPEGSRGFLYAVEGDNLVTVQTLTNKTITFSHYREPTAIADGAAGTTEFEFPRDFLDLLVYNAVASEWMSALMLMPESKKEQRRVLETEYNRLMDPRDGLIPKRERELEKRTQIPAEIVLNVEPDIYQQMFNAAEMQWDHTLDFVSRIDDHHTRVW